MNIARARSRPRGAILASSPSIRMPVRPLSRKLPGPGSPWVTTSGTDREAVGRGQPVPIGDIGHRFMHWIDEISEALTVSVGERGGVIDGQRRRDPLRVQRAMQASHPAGPTRQWCPERVRRHSR